MERKRFMQIIKLRSAWKIDRRRGDYKLPNGDLLSKYIRRLIESQMHIDSLGILEDGGLCFCSGGNWNSETKEFEDYTLNPAFGGNESCSYDEMNRRVSRLVYEIIG